MVKTTRDSHSARDVQNRDGRPAIRGIVDTELALSIVPERSYRPVTHHNRRTVEPPRKLKRRRRRRTSLDQERRTQSARV